MQRKSLTKIWYKLEKENVCLQNKMLCLTTAIHLKRFQIFTLNVIVLHFQFVSNFPHELPLASSFLM